MPDQEKIRAVYDYLQREFPGFSIVDAYDADRRAQSFQIRDRSSAHQALVFEEFLDGHDACRIPDLLTGFTLAEHLRGLGSTPVLVTNSGLKLEYE